VNNCIDHTTCRHCSKPRAASAILNGYRGLCWTCHQQPAIRELYPKSAVKVDRPKVPCVKCGNLNQFAARPHGHCRVCYDKFQPVGVYRSKHAPRNALTGQIAGNKKPRPTRAVPGSEEKIAALAARVANGEELWHEADGVEPTLKAPKHVYEVHHRGKLCYTVCTDTIDE
jgi:hypothetical protein